MKMSTYDAKIASLKGGVEALLGIELDSHPDKTQIYLKVISDTLNDLEKRIEELESK